MQALFRKQAEPKGQGFESSNSPPTLINNYVKLLELINEDFSFSTPQDSDLYRSLSGVIKSGGAWKSTKQRDFLMNSNRSPMRTSMRDDAPELKKFFGVILGAPDQKAVVVDAMISFAPGSRGLRPVTWMFVVDEIGVVAKYRIRYRGNMRDGTAPDPSKTTVEWARDPSVDASHLDPVSVPGDKPSPPPSTSVHVGTPGQRETFQDLTVKKIIDRGYGQWLSILEDPAGNTFFYNGSIGDEGDTVTLKATVKSHIYSKRGEPVTVINRPKIQ